MKPVKRAVLFHDICSFGKAALTNMLPVLSREGIEACPIPTMLLSTHTGGYGAPAVHSVSPSFIRACADHYVSQQITFDLIFVGYPGTCEMAEAIIYFIRQFRGTKVMLDPIMGDHGKYYSNFDDSYKTVIQKLLPLSDIILPNFTEACLLAGADFQQMRTQKDFEELCRTLAGSGAGKVIITSLPSETGTGIVYYDGARFAFFTGETEPMDFHGSGDVFSAFLAADYLNGIPLEESIRRAHRFVKTCIAASAEKAYEEREGLLLEETLSKFV